MTTPPAPGAWPLSAAATAMLRDPGLSAGEALKHALKELVVRGVLRIGTVEPRAFRPPRVTLVPGTRDAADLPVPLPALAGAVLPHVAAGGTEAGEAVQKAVGGRRDLLVRLHTETRDDLDARGLLTTERYRLLGLIPRTRPARTPSGEVWAAVPRDLELGRAAAGAALPAVGLLLALDQAVARALRPPGDGQPVVWAGDTSGATDHPPDRDTLDAVLGDVGAGLDGAVDGGAGSGGGDGGDGGGGGGGGD